MRKRLSEEVTREEMLRLREQGYSNTEIAEQLECCYPTVIKYIGKSGIRRANRKDENPAEIKKPEAVNTERLKLVCKTFSGASASFELSRGGVTVVFEDGRISMNPERFREFAKDVLAVSQIARGDDGIQL